jgi:hypothetical protein
MKMYLVRVSGKETTRWLLIQAESRTRAEIAALKALPESGSAWAVSKRCELLEQFNGVAELVTV